MLKSELIILIEELDKEDICLNDLFKLFNDTIEPNRITNKIKHKSIEKYDGYFVYYMYSNSNLFYIGITKNLYNRMSMHFNPYTLRNEKWKFDLSHIICKEYSSYDDICKIEILEINKHKPHHNKIEDYRYKDVNYIIPKEINTIKINVIPHLKDNNLRFQFEDENLKMNRVIKTKDTLDSINDFILNNIKVNELDMYDFFIDKLLFEGSIKMMNFINSNLLEINKLTLRLGFEFKVKEEIRPYIIKTNREKISSEKLKEYDNTRNKFLDNFIIERELETSSIKIKEFKNKYNIKDSAFSIVFKKYEDILKDYGVYKIGNDLLFI